MVAYVADDVLHSDEKQLNERSAKFMIIERAIELMKENPEGTKAILDFLLKIWNNATLGDQVDFINRFVHSFKVE